MILLHSQGSHLHELVLQPEAADVGVEDVGTGTFENFEEGPRTAFGFHAAFVRMFHVEGIYLGMRVFRALSFLNKLRHVAPARKRRLPIRHRPRLAVNMFIQPYQMLLLLLLNLDHLLS